MKKSRAKQSKRNIINIKTIHPNIYLGILILLVISIYAITTTFNFVGIDDDKLILENEVVTNPQIPYSEAFIQRFFNVHYKPLVIVSWKAERDLLGTSPWHFHLINWLLHLANTIILFFIGIKLFEKLYDNNKPLLLFSAFLLALLFTINPLRIESVAWATERKDVLFSFFFLLSWLSYINYIGNKKNTLLVFSSLLYLLSGLSKSAGLTLFAILLLTDFWFKRKFNLKLALEKIPHLIVFISLIFVYGFFSSHSTESLPDTVSATVNETQNLISNLPMIANLPFIMQWAITSSVRFILWIVHILLPVYLSILYSHNDIFAFLGVSIFAFPFLVATLYLWAWVTRKKNPELLGGLLFFAITLSPALVLISSGTFIFLADRYTYIPSIGILFILITLLNRLANKKQTLYYFTLATLSIFYFGISLKNVSNWKDSESLYKQAIEISPNKSMLYQNLARLYKKQKKYELEFQTYNAGIKKINNDYLLYSSRGKIFFNNSKLDLALSDYNKCLALSPDFTEGLANRGAVYGMKKQWNKALADLNKALKINPEYTNALSNRGLIYFQLKQYEKTIEDYTNYLQQKPNNPDITNTIGLCYSRLKKYDKAIIEFNKSIKTDSTKGAYFLNRSFAFNAKENKAKALKDAIKAKQLGANVNANYINYLKNSH